MSSSISPSFRIVAVRAWLLAALLLTPLVADALPAFARQTGQNCIACHAGGQFPELTPYGRLFKLTGYTVGARSLPVAVMAVASMSRVRNTSSPDPSADFPKDGAALFQTGSVFLAGKVSDNVGLFLQATYDNYESQDAVNGRWHGKWTSDNIDLRYADHWIDPGRDLIVGLSLNNNPSVADPWNTAPAWIDYVPTRFGFTGPSAAPVIAQLGQQAAGVGAYAFWNKGLYAEVAGYQTANGAWSILSQGISDADQTKLRGTNPYVRLALTREWGAHNAMVGLLGMNADVYPDNVHPGGPVTRYRDRGVDAQYQYLLDPHTVTAQLSYIRETIDGGDLSGVASNAANTLRQLKLKASYVHRAKFGGSLGFFNTTGSSDSVLYPSGLSELAPAPPSPTPVSGNVANSPTTRGWIPELFWIPTQYVRVGAQYFAFDRFNGAKRNYDGAGRDASANNTLFVYVWGAH